MVPFTALDFPLFAVAFALALARDAALARTLVVSGGLTVSFTLLGGIMGRSNNFAPLKSEGNNVDKCAALRQMQVI